MSRRRLIVLVIVIGALAAACGSEGAGGPPEINFGRDICIECGMIIDDARFAAAYRSADGTEFKFDDLGGLIIHSRENGGPEDAQVWVSDFDEKTLIEAESAHYVPTLGVASPMGHGILAFADHGRAMKTAVDLGGEVVDWPTVVDLPATEGLVGHHHVDTDDGMADDDHEQREDG